jgi:PAS domain S-box-containing protein
MASSISVAKIPTSNLTRTSQNTRVLQSVFDQLADALVLWDPELRITGVNRSAERLFGTSSRKMLGKQFHEVFQCAACGPDRGVLLLLDRAPSATHETISLKAGGIDRLVLMSTTQVLDENGRLAGAVSTVRALPRKAVLQTQVVIAQSAAMLDILKFVQRIATSEAATILLDGENGTGKDLIAKTLHYQSLRRGEPFIAVNCAAIPDTLLESELFGHERGAFTGADLRKRGIFELADKGTLFLDEIGEVPPILQAKLLRVLEDRTFRRLGGLIDIHVDLPA